MDISDIKIRLVKKDDLKLKAVASMIVDEGLAVHDIKIIEGTNGNFIAMPSRKVSSGEFKDIVHPIKSEVREHICSLILEAYAKELQKPIEETD
ncbi:MAG: SpoVG family protein [Clostridiales bacterium]|nr:SpoVG family protein [Clostridiales bacterium]